MKRKKLKSYVLPSLLMILIAGTIFLTSITTSLNKNKEDVSTYVSRIILEPDVPVINNSSKVINPYTDPSVTVGKSYYDYKADAKDQEKSIIYHDNTYMQNSGIDFVSKNTFDVVAVLNGTVTDVKEDETLGKIVEIKHDNDYVSIYQSLSEVEVKKGDKVTQGQVLGKSGNNELDKDMGNHLHFEFYINGQVVNPSLYLDKEINNNKTKE